VALLSTPPLEDGLPAPTFALPDPSGRTVTLDDVAGRAGTVVMFICNHCPYVQAILPELIADVRTLTAEGFGVVAIMPNDFERYPADAPAAMARLQAESGLDCPYLVDATQAVAKAYGAVCTPDFFGFDQVLRLRYRGRLSATTPARAHRPEDPRELVEAMRAIARGEGVPAPMRASQGCSIKWREDG
jgi:peroxiredoxin